MADIYCRFTKLVTCMRDTTFASSEHITVVFTVFIMTYEKRRFNSPMWSMVKISIILCTILLTRGQLKTVE